MRSYSSRLSEQSRVCNLIPSRSFFQFAGEVKKFRKIIDALKKTTRRLKVKYSFRCPSSVTKECSDIRIGVES